MLVYIYSRGVWVEAPGQHSDSEINTLTDSRYRPEGLRSNATPWDADKIGLWTGTQAQYNALTPAQRAAYNLLATSG